MQVFSFWGIIIRLSVLKGPVYCMVGLSFFCKYIYLGNNWVFFCLKYLFCRPFEQSTRKTGQGVAGKKAEICARKD